MCLEVSLEQEKCTINRVLLFCLFICFTSRLQFLLPPFLSVAHLNIPHPLLLGFSSEKAQLP